MLFHRHLPSDDSHSIAPSCFRLYEINQWKHCDCHHLRIFGNAWKLARLLLIELFLALALLGKVLTFSMLYIWCVAIKVFFLKMFSNKLNFIKYSIFLNYLSHSININLCIIWKVFKNILLWNFTKKHWNVLYLFELN